MNIEGQEQLRTFIKKSENFIPKDGFEAVNHYFEHGEYEMSFEGLVIELMNSEVYPDDFVFSEWENLALSFNLDKDSVFDGDFWTKFKYWGKELK